MVGGVEIESRDWMKYVQRDQGRISIHGNIESVH